MTEENDDISYRGIIIFAFLSLIFYFIMRDKTFLQIDLGIFVPAVVGMGILGAENN